DICLRLSLISSDEEVSNRLIIMAREYAAKADAAGSARGSAPRRRADAIAGCRAGRRGVELGAGRPRVARRVLARPGPQTPRSFAGEARRVGRGGLEPIDAEAGANRADQPSASIVSSASARCRSRG